MQGDGANFLREARKGLKAENSQVTEAIRKLAAQNVAQAQPRQKQADGLVGKLQSLRDKAFEALKSTAGKPGGAG